MPRGRPIGVLGACAALFAVAVTSAPARIAGQRRAPAASVSFAADVARSPRRTLRVAPVVTLSRPPEGTALLAGPAGHLPSVNYDENRDRVTFSGSVTPPEPGAIAVLQRERAGASEEWIPIASAPVAAAGSSFAIPVNFRVPGDVNIRVLVRAQPHISPRYAPGVSTPVSYEISQAQNPRLTINASADPTSYGSSITISGVLAGGGREPVTLFTAARGATNPADFRPRRKSTTTPRGAYRFHVSPPTDTLYWVTGGGQGSGGLQGSAVLPEAVKYALTVTPPAATIGLGEALTISGRVAPAQAGHAVYLERQNRSGIGFHIVDVGAVSAGGAYSISHAFYDSGAARLRIKVPGDALHATAASAPFDVTVTPAPAFAITPQPPGSAKRSAESPS